MNSTFTTQVLIRTVAIKYGVRMLLFILFIYKLNDRKSSNKSYKFDFHYIVYRLNVNKFRALNVKKNLYENKDGDSTYLYENPVFFIYKQNRKYWCCLASIHSFHLNPQ